MNLLKTNRYTPACSQLISQFKTAKSFMGPSFDLNQFLSEYRVRWNGLLGFFFFFGFFSQLFS